MKLVSYNVNGIRAAFNKGLESWISDYSPDVACFQEVKAESEQVDLDNIKKLGYEVHWHSAEKKGYSGVAVFTKTKPLHVEIGCGIEKYDREGRVIRVDFEDYSVLNVYMPSGSSGEERQAFKMIWLDDFYSYISGLKKKVPNLIICGDFNICHKPIDIHNPVSNKKSSGFLPEEREWLSSFFDNGFVDSFREFNQEPDNYSWWTYRYGARKNNKGWRIDYFAVSESLKSRLIGATIEPDAMHSDHCPVTIEIS